MRTTLTLALAVLITTGAFAPKAQALGVATSFIAGVVVANYAGAAAGVAVSSALYVVATTTGGIMAKEEIAKAVQNDLQEYYLNGTLSVALEKSVLDLMSKDAELSEADALDLIASAFQE